MNAKERELLAGYLRDRLNPHCRIDAADDEGDFVLWIGEDRRGVVSKDDEDPSDVSYAIAMTFKTSPAIDEAENRLRELLNPAISLRSRKSLGRTKIEDSVEMYVGAEFMGLVYRDKAPGGFVEYTVEIQILPEDLEEV